MCYLTFVQKIFFKSGSHFTLVGDSCIIIIFWMIKMNLDIFSVCVCLFFYSLVKRFDWFLYCWWLCPGFEPSLHLFQPVVPLHTSLFILQNVRFCLFLFAKLFKLSQISVGGGILMSSNFFYMSLPMNSSSWQSTESDFSWNKYSQNHTISFFFFFFAHF